MEFIEENRFLSIYKNKWFCYPVKKKWEKKDKNKITISLSDLFLAMDSIQKPKLFTSLYSTFPYIFQSNTLGIYTSSFKLI